MHTIRVAEQTSQTKKKVQAQHSKLTTQPAHTGRWSQNKLVFLDLDIEFLLDQVLKVNQDRNNFFLQKTNERILLYYYETSS